jgi:nitroimidazol reductase NimA-like FMN-containing flavoprotein (pyridoxamine 5'-phosphate oxidase superfamily)
MPDPIVLSHATCAELLAAGVVGRIAFSTPTGPEVIPVNYAVIDATVVIRTSPYGVLATHGRGARAAFEIDQFDHVYEQGWSVVAHGRLAHLTDPVELERVQSTWKPRPWAGGASRHLYLQLTWDALTGRRLGTGFDLMGAARPAQVPFPAQSGRRPS